MPTISPYARPVRNATDVGPHHFPSHAGFCVTWYNSPMIRIALLLLAACSAPVVIPDGPAPQQAVTVMLSRDGTDYCAGTWIAPDRILTAAHCLLVGLPAEIRFQAGRPPAQTVPICADFRNDLAVLQTPGFEVARWARVDRRPGVSGDRVTGIGAGNGEPWSAFEGTILLTKGSRLFLLAPVRPGHSGGGIFRDGRLLGVITHYSEDLDFGVGISAAADSLCTRNR